MVYDLGIDLGTTYTAAAVARDGQVDIVTLGNRAAVIPTVVYLREDEQILAGEAAARRALAEPGRVAREFKRRVGDPTPLLLGGTPYSAEALFAKLLRWTVDKVSEREGGPPRTIAVSHPANWGPYKRELLTQAIRLADIGDAATISEPEAAAIYYASNERIDVGATIAVYDLGGGTFDAAVLRKTVDGWEVLGSPEGIERLGGIDFDEAVFNHVRRSLAEEFAALDLNDPAAMAAVARVREECVLAKEALSSDTEASIPVMLPNLQTEVRLTRAEFEAMIRPTLQETVGAMRRALRSAGVEPDGVDAVLLVGGSSRIPLVAQLISSELGRPVAVDAHPKHAVAMGAALSASRGVAEPTAASPPTPPPVVSPPTTPTPPIPPVAPPPQPAGAGSRRGLVAVAGVVGLAAIAGIAFALTRGGTPPGATPSGPSDTPSTTATTTSSPSSSPTPSTTAREEPFAEILSIDFDGPRYSFTYRPTGFLPDTSDPESFHVHFFWSSLEPVNAGTNGPAPGAWLLWDTPTSVNNAMFDAANRPTDATGICVIIADHEHAVADVDGDEQTDLDTGNCVDLPS